MARNQAPKIEIFFLNISVRRAHVSYIICLLVCFIFENFVSFDCKKRFLKRGSSSSCHGLKPTYLGFQQANDPKRGRVFRMVICVVISHGFTTPLGLNPCKSAFGHP